MQLINLILLFFRKILKYTLNKLRVAVGTREQTKSALVKATDKLRIAYRKLAREMVKEGLLPSENLIFHLTHYELQDIVNRRSPIAISK